MFLRPSGGASPHLSHALSHRVLQLLPDTISPRATHHSVAIAEALKRNGGEMIVAGGDARTEARLRRANIDHRPFSGNVSSLFQTRATQALLDTVHQRNIALIHVHGCEVALAAKAFAEVAHLPLVMTCDEMPKVQGFLGRRTARKHLAGRPIITRSRFAAETLRRDFHIPAEVLRVVYPGIRSTDFDPAAVSAERTIALAAAWGLSDDARPVVLVPNAQADPAWLNLAIQAAMTADAPEAAWVLIGPEAATEAVNARLTGQGANGRIRWVSPCDDMPAAYKLAAVVACLPESIPGATPPLCEHALEAQAMGRAVVTSDFAAGAEVIEPGKTGWLTRHRDAGSLTYAVSAALDRDEVIVGAMGMAAQNFVRTRFNPAAQQAAILEIYADALAHP